MHTHEAITGVCCEHAVGLNEAIAARDAVLARLKPGECYSRDMVVAEMEARAARRAVLVNRIHDLEAENAELRRSLTLLRAPTTEVDNA